MGPILNPKPDLAPTESWQAWKSCIHVNDKSVNKSDVSDIATSAVEGHEQLKQESTLDQTACDNQVLSNDHNDAGYVPSSDEGTVYVEDTAKKETGKVDSETAAVNADLSHDGDLNTVGVGGDGNADPFTDTVSTLSAGETAPSRDQIVHKSNGDLPLKDSSVSTLDGQASACSECQKIRRQKMPFLNKRKSCCKFVWNKYLLQGFEGAVHSDWILHIVNGFVGQSSILFATVILNPYFSCKLM